jgi:hypothetical protein
MSCFRVTLLLLMSVYAFPVYSAHVAGIIDGVYNNSTVKGWACVTTLTKSIPIHIYVGGPAGSGKLLSGDVASDYSEAAVDKACQHQGSRARHRFSYTFTNAQKKAYQGKKIYIYGIDKTYSNRVLHNSGSFVVPEVPIGTGIIDGITNGRLSGWACVKGETKSVTVDLYVGGKRIKTVIANRASGAAVATECGHAVQQGDHRFYVTLTNSERKAYEGKKLSVRIRETSSWLANSWRYIIPGPGIGSIDGNDNGRIYGRACIKGDTKSILVDVYAGGRKIKTVRADQPSFNDVATECGHAGKSGNHKFSVSLTNSEKTLYAGDIFSVRIQETSSWLENPDRLKMPGDVSYVFVYKSPDMVDFDQVHLSWDNVNTRNCSEIEGTLVSFPGGDGKSHGASKVNVEKVEKVIGNGCVRLVRADINPKTIRYKDDNGNQYPGGYWLGGPTYQRDSYRKAAAFMTGILEHASTHWKDAAGQAPIQGKLMVAGSSAGGMIAAAALEWQPNYYNLVDRTIFVSAPLGSDLSHECGLLRNQGIKNWLDEIFNLTTNTCASCDGTNECKVSADKDVVDVKNTETRSYLNTSSEQENVHELAILIGTADAVGCGDSDITKCGSWNGTEAVWRYIHSITAEEDSRFQLDGVSSEAMPFTLTEIEGGSHDLWNSSDAKKYICKNALEEVGKSYEVCDSEL